jgi:hypothetical protein
MLLTMVKPFPAIALSLAVAAMALQLTGPSAVIAHADSYDAFQSPSENIYCGLSQTGTGTDAVCEVADHTWAAPPRPTPCMGAWGDRISMRQGSAPRLSCHSDTVKDPRAAVLQYGQTQSLNSLRCDSEISGITCSDSSTGHYFVLARDNYELH